MSARIALVPLDERPVCLRLPSMTAAVAGAVVHTPPPSLLPRRRVAGDCEGIARWLVATARDSDAVVVSLETLGLGGLIPSRLGDESVETVLGRWVALRDVTPPVLASVVVPRIPDVDDAAEEPTYWARHGRALHRHSSALVAGDDSEARRAAIPAPYVADWLARRLRQHTVALRAVGLVAEGVLDTLLVGIDDAQPGSLSEVDAARLEDWVRRLALPQVLVQPGTDETGTVLVARALAAQAGHRPRVRVVCAAPGGLDRLSPYEIAPVGQTCRRQLTAAGAEAVDPSEPGAVDAVLVVHAPEGNGDWAVAPPSHTDAEAARATAELVTHHLGCGDTVGVADVAQPNGADPALVSALAEDDALRRLSAYGAWNTAGNTLGAVAAHLVAGVVGRMTGSHDPEADRILLAHRLVEDWAWMTLERARLRASVGSDPSRHDDVDLSDRQLRDLTGSLDAHLASLPGFADLRVLDGTVRLPWRRTYEVDLVVGMR